ncbi:MAG: hypothetical protein WBD63_02485 [Phycisphaerae bacterium]|nr:hypothetical protein [Phycisphaerae bacterium]
MSSNNDQQTRRVQRNLPLEYVREKTGCDVTVYQKIALVINVHAYSAADEFAQLLELKPNAQLVHFFHDMLMVVGLLPMIGRLSPSKDIASAIIDGVHFEFYEDASPSIVESILHLWAEKPKCFLHTFINTLEEEGAAMRFAAFAVYGLAPEYQLGISKAQSLGSEMMRIVKEKASSVSTVVDIILEG